MARSDCGFPDREPARPLEQFIGSLSPPSEPHVSDKLHLEIACVQSSSLRATTPLPAAGGEALGAVPFYGEPL